MSTISIIAANADLHRRTHEAAAENISLQIDAVRRAEGGLKTMLHDTVFALIENGGWKTWQRTAWKEQLLAAMLTNPVKYMVNEIWDEVVAEDSCILSGSIVEVDKDHPEQAYISTFRNHL